MTYENLAEKLVNVFLDDSRTSLRTLAEDLDVSVTTISHHLNNLDKQGIIKGSTPNIDYDASGYDITTVI